MSYLKDIEVYAKDVIDFEVSPFETINMLHLRTRLNKESQHMTLMERNILMKSDLQLLENMDHMVLHISHIYDFSNSKENPEEWWWHLDKVASGELVLEIGLRP